MNRFEGEILGVGVGAEVLARMTRHQATPTETILDQLRRRTRYLRASEVMIILDVRRATLCSWINTRKLQAFRIGKNNMVDPAALVVFS
jgi:hypothetical protein